MPSKRSTTGKTETDLEVRAVAAIKAAFPFLPDGAIKHQVKFSFQFGRKTIEIDAEKSRAEARLDILLEMDSKPLAVMELKRPGNKLTDADGAQGLSYARLLQPPAPLVVVTNGSDVTLLETHTGQRWQPADKSEEAFKALMSQASRVAAADVRQAIDTLMGTSPAVWMQAIRQVSIDTIKGLTASWNEPALPFIEDFLTPRQATVELLQKLAAGKRLLVLEGTPLSGKSNVLRELCLPREENDTMAILFLEAGAGGGALQAVADALSRSLNWPVSMGDARDWLIRVSNEPGRRLVLAFDGLQAYDTQTIREIEDLCSNTFGPSLSIVVAVDESVSQNLLTAPNRRSASTLGRKAKVIRVGQLQDKEFSVARQLLALRRAYLMTGAEMAPEYREPWVLRAMGSFAQETLKDKPPNQALSLPSMLGLRLIGLVRERFAEDPEVRRMFRDLAHAMVRDAQDNSRPPDFALHQMQSGLIRREAVRNELEPGDLQWLTERGFVRPDMHDEAGATILVRLPELLASELAQVLADEILSRAKRDPREAGMWLAGAASNLLLGEVVAAQAIIDATARAGGLPVGIIDYLVETPPQREVVNSSGRYAALLPGGVRMEITVEPDGKAFCVINGERHDIDLGSDGHTTFTNIHPWMILSHVASVPFEVLEEGSPRRADPSLLLRIGTCPVPLRVTRGPESMHQIPLHDFPGGISVAHACAGIVEPITLGIFNFLSGRKEDSDAWIHSVVTSGSIALLYRVHTALGVLAALKTHARSQWAEQTRHAIVLPCLRDSVASGGGILEED